MMAKAKKPPQKKPQAQPKTEKNQGPDEEKNPNFNRLRPDLHNRLRDAIDPNAKFLTDSMIQRILRIVHFDLRRAAHRCFLAYTHEALAAGDPNEAARGRAMLINFERDRIKI